MDTEDLKKAASDLALKYSIDMNAAKFSWEICSFRNHAITIIPDTKEATSLDLLQIIHKYNLVQSYPNLEKKSCLKNFFNISSHCSFWWKL